MSTSAYQYPVDIANRALQHCGATRITTLADNSKNAAAVNFVYDKVRRAELRRNVWRFAIRRVCLAPMATTSMLLIPAVWSATNIYSIGSIVSYNGKTYQASTNSNLNTAPDGLNGWSLYFGTMQVDAYVSGNSYFSGQLVYDPNGSSPKQIYVSLTSSNANDPTVLPVWVSGTVYKTGDTVSYLGTEYQSTTDLNTSTPGVANWVATPVANQVDTMVGTAWLAVSCTMRAIVMNYPIGSGPQSQTETLNVYMLPNGFLREAPQDPKAGSKSYLGAEAGYSYDDWNFEGNFFVTTENTPIVFRFVADVADVYTMDDMFCEGLACRIGLEICEELTQSTGKLTNIGAQYKKFMDEARTVNGIETGPVEPPIDDYIQCRY